MDHLAVLEDLQQNSSVAVLNVDYGGLDGEEWLHAIAKNELDPVIVEIDEKFLESLTRLMCPVLPAHTFLFEHCLK
jgi:hypothetical protein